MARLAVLGATATKVVVGAVVLAVAAGVAAYALVDRGATRTVTAQFSAAVGIYPGTPVDILGVPVGSVRTVTPDGDHVSVEMSYRSEYRVPANAVAVIVANSLVSDRYIQLAPVYPGTGPTLPDGATIPKSRTAAPAELDDVYAALDKLAVALGPKGANKKGALNTFVEVAAANLKGNGQALGQSITRLSEAAKTLADGREDLFGTVRNLQRFTAALADSDHQVRHFENQLADVAGQLADERDDLGTALHELGVALNSVADFVDDNAGKFHADLDGLAKIAQILVKENSSIDETMAVAPVALANLVHAYQPSLGVLGTRSNVSSLTDPSQFCGLIGAITDQLLGNTKYSGSPVGTVIGALGRLLAENGPLSSLGDLLGRPAEAVVKTCLKFTGGRALPEASSGLPDLGPERMAAALESLVGGIGGLIGAGGGGR